MKTCSLCGLKKPAEEFEHAASADGLSSSCTACVQNPKSHREPCLSMRKHRVKGLGQRKKGRRPESIFARDPLHAMAWKAVKFALRTGRIVRPSSCEQCGLEQARLQAHHFRGYLQENWLEVRWLCQTCHDRFRSKTSEGY